MQGRVLGKVQARLATHQYGKVSENLSSVRWAYIKSMAKIRQDSFSSGLRKGKEKWERIKWTELGWAL